MSVPMESFPITDVKPNSLEGDNAVQKLLFLAGNIGRRASGKENLYAHEIRWRGLGRLAVFSTSLAITAILGVPQIGEEEQPQETGSCSIVVKPGDTPLTIAWEHDFYEGARQNVQETAGMGTIRPPETVTFENIDLKRLEQLQEEGVC